MNMTKISTSSVLMLYQNWDKQWDKHWTSIGTYKQTYTNYIKLKQTFKNGKMFKINFNFLKILKKYRYTISMQILLQVFMQNKNEVGQNQDYFVGFIQALNY